MKIPVTAGSYFGEWKPPGQADGPEPGLKSEDWKKCIKRKNLPEKLFLCHLVTSW